MSNFIEVEVKYDNNGSLLLEGFGPETVLGVVADVLNGHYQHEDRTVTGIEIRLPTEQA